MRRPWPLLLLCALLSGCGFQPSPDAVQLAPASETAQEEPPETRPPLGGVTCLPQSLVDELLRQITSGEDTYDEFLPLLAGRDLSEEEAAAAAPEAVSCDSAVSAIFSSYSAVDFDNDGMEDLFVSRRMGQGAMGRYQEEVWHGLPDGAYVCTYYEDAYMSHSFFITWEGRNYQITCQSDLCSKDGIAQYTCTGVSAACFADGSPQECACLTFDPAALWTEAVRDDAGKQTGWVDGIPAEEDIQLEVYTKGVNTDFPLPDH